MSRSVMKGLLSEASSAASQWALNDFADQPCREHVPAPVRNQPLICDALENLEVGVSLEINGVVNRSRSGF